MIKLNSTNQVFVSNSCGTVLSLNTINVAANPIPTTPIITLAIDGSLNESTPAPLYVWLYQRSVISDSAQSFIPTNK